MSGVIAVLGFGEAGSLIARDLVAAGAAVRGFDPKVPPPDGVVGADSDAEAVVGADLCSASTAQAKPWRRSPRPSTRWSPGRCGPT